MNFFLLNVFLWKIFFNFKFHWIQPPELNPWQSLFTVSMIISHDIKRGFNLALLLFSLAKNNKISQIPICSLSKTFLSFSFLLFPNADNRYSELQISQTQTSHSGNYSCVTNNAASSSTFVHIFNGKTVLPCSKWHVTLVWRNYSKLIASSVLLFLSTPCIVKVKILLSYWEIMEWP